MGTLTNAQILTDLQASDGVDTFERRAQTMYRMMVHGAALTSSVVLLDKERRSLVGQIATGNEEEQPTFVEVLLGEAPLLSEPRTSVTFPARVFQAADLSSPRTYMRLRPSVKASWLEALRSGDYQQGMGTLRTMGAGSLPDRFCCLGVLCDLQRPNVEGASWVESWSASGAYGFRIEQPEGVTVTNSFMPPELIAPILWEDGLEYLHTNYEWTCGYRASLYEANAVSPEHFAVSTIGAAGMNDDGVSFAEIARLIEAAF